MCLFLVPLLLGFTFNSASAFTAAYSARLGERGGQLVSAFLRDVLGIPAWVLGLALAVRAPAPQLVMTNRVSIAFSWFLLVAGSLLQIWAFIFMRRRGVAPTMKDSLVLEEPYARIRRPMYSGLLCQFAGLGLFVPTIPVILAFLLGVGWAVIQAYLDTRLTCSRCRASFPGVGRQELERPKAIQAHKAVVCFAGTNNETNHILVTMRVLLAAHFTPAKNTG